MNSRNLNRRGFSSVQLLIVISTVALLIGLFVPRMNHGCRGNAKRISCVNNLKQLGLAARSASTNAAPDEPSHSEVVN